MTRSLTGVIGNPFRHISFRLDPRKGIQLLVKDQPYVFTPMSDCSLDASTDASEDGEATLDCDWFYDDPKKAKAQFDKMVAEFDRCLPSPLDVTRKERKYDKHKKLASGNVEHPTRRGTTEVDVTFLGFPDYKERDKPDWKVTRYWVGLNITYQMETEGSRK